MTPEQEAIEAGYQAHIQTLFKTLISGLATDADEQGCLNRFNAGIRLARRAKELAQQQEESA